MPAGTRGSLLARIFGIDLRALAAMRIGIGLILVFDLASRAVHFSESYADSGPVPRALLDSWMTETIAPFHLWSGDVRYQAVLHGLSFVFAWMLLLGVRTRLAAVASWLLLVSLQVRNPFLLNFGDEILRVCLFWALFLPLGRVWSFDARRAVRPAARVVLSIASAALLLQVCFVYFFTALLKTGPSWHGEGTAVYYTLHYDSIARPLAAWMRQQVPITQFITWATLVLEYVGPFLLLTPLWPVRLLAALGFVSLHAGIAASLNLGIFPFIDFVALLPFLPSPVWDRLESLVRRAFRAAPLPIEAAGAEVSAPRGALQIATATAVGAFLAFVFAYNLSGVWTGLALPSPIVRAGFFLGLKQEWRMFTPDPAREDGWLVMPARLANGALIDLSEQGPTLTWSKPRSGWNSRRSVRWGFYLNTLRRTSANGSIRRSYLRWRCREWNLSHPDAEQIQRVDLFYMREQIPPPPGGSRHLDKLFLASHECPMPGARPAPGWDVAVPESGASPTPITVGPPPLPVIPSGS